MLMLIGCLRTENTHDKKHFNTSHVNVNLIGTNPVNKPFLNFNTSHVNVNRKANLQADYYIYVFQYISC